MLKCRKLPDRSQEVHQGGNSRTHGPLLSPGLVMTQDEPSGVQSRRGMAHRYVSSRAEERTVATSRRTSYNSRSAASVPESLNSEVIVPCVASSRSKDW